MLNRIDVVDGEKLEKIERATAARGLLPSERERTRSLRERDLNCGEFTSADLRRIDFFGAQLQGAKLNGAQLQGANFDGARLEHANLGGAGLQGANLTQARLLGANFTEAHLQGAELEYANLHGATLYGAELQGASLHFVSLEGADLYDAGLQGARLTEAFLQSANLTEAHLQGADLTKAQLQGANLRLVELKLALLSDVYLWRARPASCSDARITGPKFDERPFVSDPPARPITVESYVERYERFGLNGEAIKRMREGLLDPIQKADLAAIEADWTNCAARSQKIAESEYLEQHAGFLSDIVCNATQNREEIAIGIIRNWISDAPDRRNFSSRLASGLLGCGATKNLGEKTQERIRKTASTPTK
jgi:uncharacterized protein YjbI with pentapeptide repeats